MEFRKIALPVMAAAAMGLVACGENGTSEQYLVKADGEAYFCNGKDWKVLGGATSADTVFVSDG